MFRCYLPAFRVLAMPGVLLFFAQSTLAQTAQTDQAVQSQPLGIRFSEMPVGTEWTIEYLDKPRRYAYTYIGAKQDQHLLRIEALNHPPKTGEQVRKQIAIRYFDAQGRLLRSESHLGAVRTYTPFDCAYQVGRCTHTLRYPLPPRNGKARQRTMTQRYLNELDGDTFTLGRYNRNGEKTDFMFTLGQYNIRVHNRYTNRLGQKRGFNVTAINPSGR